MSLTGIPLSSLSWAAQQILANVDRRDFKTARALIQDLQAGAEGEPVSGPTAQDGYYYACLLAIGYTATGCRGSDGDPWWVEQFWRSVLAALTVRACKGLPAGTTPPRPIGGHTFRAWEMQAIRDAAPAWPGEGTWRGLIAAKSPHVTEPEIQAFLRVINAGDDGEAL